MVNPTCVVILPTYNEAGNIKNLVKKVLASADGIEVVVVDDDSTDGTWQSVAALAEKDERVKLVRRRGKRGRGLAGRAGYRYALDRGVPYIIEMDADLSHDPAHIPAMLEAIKRCDMVVGSRYVPGGADERRSVPRKAISTFARVLIGCILGVHVNDPTSGFRCFSKKTLENCDPELLRSETPFIILETLYRAFVNGAVIKEVPIRFHPRRDEASKLSAGILAGCLLDVVLLRLKGTPRGRAMP